MSQIMDQKAKIQGDFDCEISLPSIEQSRVKANQKGKPQDTLSFSENSMIISSCQLDQDQQIKPISLTSRPLNRNTLIRLDVKSSPQKEGKISLIKSGFQLCKSSNDSLIPLKQYSLKSHSPPLKISESWNRQSSQSPYKNSLENTNSQLQHHEDQQLPLANIIQNINVGLDYLQYEINDTTIDISEINVINEKIKQRILYLQKNFESFIDGSVDFIQSYRNLPTPEMRQTVIDDVALYNSEHTILKRLKNSVFFGEIINNQRCGKGIAIYKNGRSFEGEWQNNCKFGKGFEIYPNGNRYEGFFVNGKSEGMGTYIWANNEIYDGQWLGGMKHGSGMWRGPKGDSYIGEWKFGKADGYGVHTWLNGDRYEGQFKACLKHGEGTEKFANGDIYQGSYVNGRPEGQGVYTWQCGSNYSGSFKNGLRHGEGKWIKIQGQLFDSYEGQYQNDKKCGYGEYKWASGNVYKGLYFDDLRHGLGEMAWIDGSIYMGMWEKGKESGEGELTVPSQIKIKGIFKDNLFTQIGEEEDEKNIEESEKPINPSYFREKIEQIHESTEISQTKHHKFRSKSQINDRIQTSFSVSTPKTIIHKQFINTSKIPNIQFTKMEKQIIYPKSMNLSGRQSIQISGTQSNKVKDIIKQISIPETSRSIKIRNHKHPGNLFLFNDKELKKTCDEFGGLLKEVHESIFKEDTSSKSEQITLQNPSNNHSNDIQINLQSPVKVGEHMSKSSIGFIRRHDTLRRSVSPINALIGRYNQFIIEKNIQEEIKVSMTEQMDITPKTPTLQKLPTQQYTKRSVSPYNQKFRLPNPRANQINLKTQSNNLNEYSTAIKQNNHQDRYNEFTYTSYNVSNPLKERVQTNPF